MEIIIRIEAYAYAEDELHGEYFDPPDYGLLGPDIMEPLARVRGTCITASFNNNTILNDIETAIEKSIYGDEYKEFIDDSSFYFLYKNERYRIIDKTANFQLILTNYLDPHTTGTITACFLVSHDAGTIEPKNAPLRYYVNSHEQGSHNEPHIHVVDTSHKYSASIRISDGKILAGYLPGKYAKMAKKMILSDQRYYYHCWNTMTDGLQVDINHHLGLINY